MTQSLADQFESYRQTYIFKSQITTNYVFIKMNIRSRYDKDFIEAKIPKTLFEIFLT